MGDIRIPEAKKLVETYFGDIPAQPQPQRPDMTEPAFQAHNEVYKDPMARVPAVMIGWPGAEAAHAGLLCAEYAGRDSDQWDKRALPAGSGEGKRIHYSIRIESGMAHGELPGLPRPLAYLRNVSLPYKPNFTSQQIVDQVQGEIAKLQGNAPLPADELERAKTQLRATMIKQLQSSLTRAQQLGQY